ncbi:torsin-1A-interacting protein 2 isoform X2 [Larimichthys crocea]|uniref:torsin-1A-interacting protein 2 isoform X2 n=1 Tax=Larimichthys crocea TaxID=215358 RepID=UPI000F5E2505|nr:torsin-1A-interacting protein 2 isoform X2 [Larimichthys crocea]
MESRPVRRSQRQSTSKDSPSKKSRKETGREEVGGGENKMDVQESAEHVEENGEQEIEDSSYNIHQPEICPGAGGDVNLLPRVALGERYKPSHAVNEAKTGGVSSVNFSTRVVLGDCCRPSHAKNETETVKPSNKGPAAPKTATQIRSRHRITTMEEYRKTMEAEPKSIGKPQVNHYAPSMYPASSKSCATRQIANNIPTQKKTEQKSHKKAGIKETDVKKRGCMWYFWRFVLLVLLSTSAFLLAYMIIPIFQRTADSVKHPPRVVEPEKFADHLTLLETQFPSQRSDLWKRSKIHLEKHLNTAHPTEPVSLIFTSGLKAEKTLKCLAQGLASSFSSALNASVLHIDGASKASQDSDEVKLDVDSQLQAAFEGDKPVAVIHRFEELPPGSTLIFYRYCDHESAAYKQVFLLFTVLLPQDEIENKQSLKEVEEAVQDYVKARLVGSGNQTAFNEMDADKYGGLWSRISHLVLPVVSEKEVEQKGC